MADSDPRLDQILEALGQLTTVVGALAQHVASTDTAASAPTAAEPAKPLNLTQDDGYLPLVPSNDENLLRRTRLAQQLGIIGDERGAALIEGGARGFYRGLDRDEGQVRLGIPQALCMLLVEDALAEDPREAADMGLDLLKVWEEDEELALARAPVVK